jgi:cell shape-determining protein MreC
MRTIQNTRYEFREVTTLSQHQVAMSLLMIGAVVVLEFFGVLQPVRRLGEWMLVPVMNRAAQCVHALKLPYFVIRQSYRSYTSVKELELEYSRATSQLADLESLKKENEELRELVKQKQSSSGEAATIAPILVYSQPRIGKGNRDGIQSGDLVMIVQTLIGRVNEVSDSQSSLTLLTATHSLPILVKTESGVTGVVVGNGSQLLMKEIPQDADIQVGQRVLTVGQAEVPRGLSVGRIQSISHLAVNSSQVAVIDQVVSFYESHLVEVQSP